MWICEKFISDAGEEVWRVYEDSDPSYEATICELWSAEHDNQSLAQQICSNANLIEQQEKRIAELERLNLTFAQNEQQLAALKSATKLLIRMFFVDLEACDPEKETEERFMQLIGQ